MEWPNDLLELFDDPILDGVRPKPVLLTADDRRVKKLLEITEWSESHDNSLPDRNGADLAEKRMARALDALRKETTEALLAYDKLNLLKKEE